MNSILASVRFKWNKTEKTVAPEASQPFEPKALWKGCNYADDVTGN